MTKSNIIKEMAQTIAVWRLARKLKKICNKAEVTEHDHADETGHSFRACVSENGFLNKVSNGNPKKKAVYADSLSLAKNKIKIIDSSIKIEKCKDCNKEIKVKVIRLNDDGLDFVGILDLLEFFLGKYKSTVAMVIIPILTFVLGFTFNELIIKLLS